MSETTTNGQAASAARTASASGIDTTGFVRHDPDRLDLAARRRRRTGRRPCRPGLVATRSLPQKRPTRSMSSGVKSICAASMLASPPTSRPPMALGWPVTENGPMPGRPMRPVSRWTVDDRVDLVGAAGRLIDPLRIDRDDALGFLRTSRRSSADRRRSKPGRRADAIGRPRLGDGERLLERRWCARRRSARRATCRARKMREQADEQRAVAVRTNRQVQIGEFGGRGAARIDQDDAHRGPRGLGL